MAIGLRGITTNNGGAFGAATVSIAPPAGTTTGDLCVLVVLQAKEGTTAATTPAGWTSQGASTSTGTGSGGVASVFTKSASASEGSVSITDKGTACIYYMVFTGASTTDPIDQGPTFGTVGASPAAITSFTPSSGAASVVAYGILAGSAAVTGTTPSGWTAGGATRVGNYENGLLFYDLTNDGSTASGTCSSTLGGAAPTYPVRTVSFSINIGITAKTTTDSASTSDSSDLQAGVSTTSDPWTLAESSSIYQTYYNSTSDSASLSESTSINKFTSDSATLSDSSSVYPTYLKSTTDAGTLSESSSVFQGVNLATTDSATVTESSSATFTVGQGQDVASVIETAQITVSKSTTDSASTTDTSSLSASPTTSDSSSLTDTSSPINTSTQITPTESAVFSETSSLTVTTATSDTASFSDGDTRDEYFSRTDSVSFTESSSVTVTTATSDFASLIDFSAPINSNNQIVSSDTFGLTESISSTSALSTSDSSVFSDGDLESSTWSRTDSATLSESSKLNQNRTDSATLSDNSIAGQFRSETFALMDNAQQSGKSTDSSSFSEFSSLSQETTESAAFSETAQLRVFLNVDDEYTVDDGPIPSISRPISSPDGDKGTLVEQASRDELPRYTEDLITYQDYVVPNKRFRVIAQDHFTRQFIHWDLPLDNVVITYTLSGPNLFSGVLSSEMESIMTLDPPLIPDRTWIHVEEDGVIRGSFLLTPFLDDPQTQTRQIEAEGFSVYPHWIYYEGESYTGIQVDPADMIRKIWDHVQSYPDGYLGVQVSQTKTSVKIGEPPESVAFTTSEGVAVNFTAGPYTLNYWSVTNCGDEIDKLCKETPIEYIEYSYWNEFKSDIVHKILLGYPRVGTKRTDLNFVEGQNMAQLIPSYQGSNDNYASDVIVIGAGTGPASVRAVASGRIGLLRKTNVIQDQNITNHDRAQAIANFEFKRIAHSRFLIQNIIVDMTHANSPWGSFAPGDDILVQGTVDYVGYVQDWYRITSWDYDPYGKLGTISLAPSDSFTYGAETTDPYSQLPTAGFAMIINQTDYSSIFATTTQGTSSDQLKGYAIQTAQMALCTYFNKNGLLNGNCYYYYLTGNLLSGGIPEVKTGSGPLSDLSEVKNIMVIGKTDQGHILTGDNIMLISKDGTVGQQANSQSEIVYPNPYYIPDPTNTDIPQLSGIQQAAYAILTRMQARLPVYEDWSWDGAPFIVTQYNDTLYEKYLGYKNMEPIMFLAYIIMGTIQ